MIAYETYKIIHLIAIVLLFSGLVGLLTVQMSGGALVGRVRTLVFASHGTGFILLLISGFGLAARLGLVRDLPGWIFVKLAIWLVLGGAISIIKRKGIIGWPLYVVLIGLFSATAIVAIYKPF